VSALPILERVKQRFDRLTDAQRLVADYIATHMDDVAFMTVEELAGASGVSPATVMRLAAELGFSGYAALNGEIRRHVRQHLGPRWGVEEPIETHTPAGAFRASLHHDQEILRQLAARFETRDVTSAAKQLLTADKVRIAGYRTSQSPAVILAWGLQLIRGEVDLLPPEVNLPERLLDLSSADVLVAFSFARYYRGTVQVVQLAAERHVPIIVIADSPLSPAARLAKTVIVIPHKSRSIPGFTVVGAIGVVNGLLEATAAMMSAAQRNRMVKRIDEAEVIESRWNFWDLSPLCDDRDETVAARGERGRRRRGRDR